jgi:transcription elongation factor Elf1
VSVVKVLHNARERPWIGEFTCQDCDSVLQVETADLTPAPDSRDGDAYKFTCPVCSHVNWVAASLIPRAGRPP